jgi:NADH-quinone oxidoreductase subunit M
MLPILLTMLLLPVIGAPVIYVAGRKSAKSAATIIAIIALVDLALVLYTVPAVLNNADHMYHEPYVWIPVINSEFTLFMDGLSLSMEIITTVLMLVAVLYSINYMKDKKNLGSYYALLSLLFVGLVGVFISSNLLFFYFCWELMLVPAFFIVGGWGYKESYRASFKFFIFTHAGAVFVLLGIGAIYMLTNSLDFFTAQTALFNANADIIKWVLLTLTAGFAVKMAIFPVHLWLPDAYAEAPAPMSALLGGVLTSAGAYAIIRISINTVLPPLMQLAPTFGIDFLHGLAIFGVISAFFGSFIALAETDMKRIIAYSSISHMGYILFGVSLYPASLASAGTVVVIAMTGTILHVVTHALSKGLFFFSAGSVQTSLKLRNIKEMGGLAGKMPVTGTSSAIAALSLAGAPPFACFISEFFIFMGALQVIQGFGTFAGDAFFIIPTALMLVATVFSLGYSLRFVSTVFLGPSRTVEPAEGKQTAPKRKLEVPLLMQVSMVILVVLVIIIGIYPGIFTTLLNTLPIP